MRGIILVTAILAWSGLALAESSSELSEAEKRALAAEIEREIDQARKEIDLAARELAALHRQKFALGKGSNKAMLGVLLDGSDASNGLEIVGVTPGGGAAAAGMQAGDRIVSINGVDVGTVEQPRKALGTQMQKIEPGDAVAVVYMRGDERVETSIETQARTIHMLALLDEQLDVQKLGLEDLRVDLKELGSELAATVGELPEMNHHMWVGHAPGSAGLMAVSGELASYFDVEEGVVLREVAPGSELQPGDVLLAVGDTAITGLEHCWPGSRSRPRPAYSGMDANAH